MLSARNAGGIRSISKPDRWWEDTTVETGGITMIAWEFGSSKHTNTILMGNGALEITVGAPETLDGW